MRALPPMPACRNAGLPCAGTNCDNTRSYGHATQTRSRYFLGNYMVGDSRHFLISILTRLRLRKKEKRTICPSCHSDNTELVNQINDGEGDWKKEEYVCYDCDCEWDWTYQRPFFHWRVKIKAPGWMEIE